MGLVDLVGHCHHVFDELRNDRGLGFGVEEVGGVDIYFEQDRTEVIACEQKVEPVDFEAAELAVEAVLCL